MKMFKGKNAVTVKMAAGAVILIILCMAVFVGLTQKAKATMSTDKVTASYTQGAESNLASALRDGYVKQNYTVANDYTDGMTKKDMSGEAAAEYGAQNLWRLFHVSLQNEKVHMTYTPANSAQTHALWFGQVNIGETMMYSFEVDAVTGANYYAFRWDYSKKHEYTNPLTNYDDFVALGVSTAKQFSLISGDNLTGKFVQERTTGKIGSGLVIDVLVTAKNGQKAMITFLKDSKDLVEVDYNSNVVQTETNLNSSK